MPVIIRTRSGVSQAEHSTSERRNTARWRQQVSRLDGHQVIRYRISSTYATYIMCKKKHYINLSPPHSIYMDFSPQHSCTRRQSCDCLTPRCRFFSTRRSTRATHTQKIPQRRSDRGFHPYLLPTHEHPHPRQLSGCLSDSDERRCPLHCRGFERLSPRAASPHRVPEVVQRILKTSSISCECARAM